MPEILENGLVSKVKDKKIEDADLGSVATLL
jgi:hypothetical protein